MNNIFKWSGTVVLVVILLFATLCSLFYFPPFQKWAVKQVTAYASEEMGLKINVGQVKLAFPLDLSLGNVQVLDSNDSLSNVMDTVADIRKVVVDIQFWPLFDKMIMVDGLSVNNMKVNTSHFIPTARFVGSIGHLDLKAHGIDFGNSAVNINHVVLKDAILDVQLKDTVTSDTTKSNNVWKVNLADLKVENTDFTLRLHRDSLSANAYFGHATARNTHFDFNKGLYAVSQFKCDNSRIRYSKNYEPKINGLDYNHIELDNLKLRANDFSYVDSKIKVQIHEGAFREKSGLRVDLLKGSFAMDSAKLSLPNLNLKTADGTAIALDCNMAMNTFDDANPGIFNVNIKGQISKPDLMTILGKKLPNGMARKWPNKPLVAIGEVRGNLQKTLIKGLNVSMPGAFKLKADGRVENMTDTRHLKANLDLNLKTHDVSFMTCLLDKGTRKNVRIPNDIGVKGKIRVNGDKYSSNFIATHGTGKLHGQVDFSSTQMNYSAKLHANAFPIQRFVPNMHLSAFTGTIQAKGHGVNFMSSGTNLVANTKIKKFSFGEYNLDHIDAKVSMRSGRVSAFVNSRNRAMKGVFKIDATTKGKRIQGVIDGDFERLDLRALHVTNEPFLLSMSTKLNLSSDLKHNHHINGSMYNIMFSNDSVSFYPEDIALDVLTRRDTTQANIDSGDLSMRLSASGGYEKLLKNTGKFASELQRQIKNKYIDQKRLYACIPNSRISVVSGPDNLISRVLKHYGFTTNNVFMDFSTSSTYGLNGNLYVDSLVVDSFQIDTVRFRIDSNRSNMTYFAQLHNGKDNPHHVFNAFLDGAINEKGTYATARVYDANDSLGVRLGLQGVMEPHGFSFHLFGENPIIGYKEFSVNDSNYVYLGDDKRVSANLVLQAKDGMGVQIYSNDAHKDVLQDVTINTHHFDLGEVLPMIPYMPNVSGVMNGDFHIIQTHNEISVSSSVNVADMVYEGNEMGNIGSEFTYMPRADGGHYVDGILTYNGDEIAALNGTYHSAGKGALDATLALENMPLDLVNGFIPNKIVGLKGDVDGALDIKGTLSTPDINGELYLDSTYVYSEPYGVEMKCANDPVTIKNSRLLFENFEMFAHNESPLTIRGFFDFSDLDRMYMNIRMRAENYLLVDSKEKERSDAYGQVYVNFAGDMRGVVNNMKLRGRLQVLGTSDLKYILKDSPLSTDNQLDGLVDFVDFRDTTKQVFSRPPITGVDVDMSINIDEGAHVNCYLNADKSNYIDIVGGGEMRFRYNMVNGVRLTGRYTIGNGEMKYSLPVIPLKTFSIQDGSYIEFRGDAMNPKLNLTATEETVATVGEASGDGRLVKFLSGVVVTKTLKDMGLEFIIDAPEDMNIHNQLKVMSKEERGKIAITMLTTGMYLDKGNASGFAVNSALSAFLNSQINHISNKALRTLDVSVGVDNSINDKGAFHTDYSFKFAKRFWNNRLRVAVGGKLSSGADVAMQNETFFDNVTLEYRLSPTSNKYLNLFYERDNYDWLDGVVSKFGGGFMWKRKLRHFKDIFSSDKKEKLLMEMNDSLSKDTVVK